MRRWMLTCVLALTQVVSGQQHFEHPWQSLNPGAGGQIQNIDLDANRPGRAFFSSDMEGAYLSDDYGETWRYIGRGLSASHTTFVTAAPGHVDHLFCGTRVGLDISDDGGKTWRAASGIEYGMPIREIAFAKGGEVVYAAPGMREHWDEGFATARGDRVMYVSRDGGSTFARTVLEPGEGERQMFSITTHPQHDERVFLAGLSGLYESRDGAATWQKVTVPAGATECWGADVSPDGGTIYAAFRTAEGSNLFAASLDTWQWMALTTDSQHGFPNDMRRDLNLWRPKIDPRSTTTEHKLLIASTRSRTGLFEVTTMLREGNVDQHQWQHILYYDKDRAGRLPQFDAGWEAYLPRSLYYNYTPLTWPGRGIWSTGDQTLFKVDATGDFSQKWQAVYTRFVAEREGVRSYRNRGVQCTFVFDGEAWKNYGVQCNADNAIIESYDNGYSWAIGLKQPRSNAVAILKELDVPIVVAHTSTGYGASSDNGTLWAKRLEHLSPRDKWVQIGGGERKQAGLPYTLYNQLLPDPANPKGLFIGTHLQGVYYVADVGALLDGKDVTATSIGGPTHVADKSTGMIFDPTDSDVLWVGDTKLLWRGRRKQQTWQWEKVREDVRSFHVWQHGTQKFIACVTGKPVEQRIELSRDGGDTWVRVLDFALLREQREESWYDPALHSEMRLLGLVGHGAKLYISAGHLPTMRAYGIFEGTIAGDSVAWRDFTDNLYFPFAVKSRVIQNEGKTWLYVGTWGIGWWRRELEVN